MTNEAEADGKVVCPDAPTMALKVVERSTDDGGKEPGHREEHEISRKTIAHGMGRLIAAYLWFLIRVLSTLHTRPWVRRAAGIPCALVFFRGWFVQYLGRDSASRECEGVSFFALALLGEVTRNASRLAV